MAEKLEKLGYVKDTFAEAIKIREAKFPTALPVEPYPVAIPHADTPARHQTVHRVHQTEESNQMV